VRRGREAVVIRLDQAADERTILAAMLAVCEALG
jgi:hypothetical protein